MPLLTQLTLPDDSAYRMDYYDSANPPQWLAGGISTLRLPTGGEFAWTYTLIDFKSQDTELFGEYVGSAFGVETKKIFTAAGVAGSLQGQWTYDYVSVGNPSTPNDPGVPCFHTTTVTDPLGHATVNYFDSASSGFSRWQYGLPFRRCNDAGASQAGDPDFLSQEIYEGDPASGTKLRSIYVNYDSDGRDAGFQQEKNHRLRLRRTEYHDDGDRFKQTEFSDFDGLGQYRQVTTTGDFSGSESRTAETTYNPGNGTLVIDPEDSSAGAGNSFVLPGVNAPWVLGTFTERTVAENGDTATAEFCFDSGTGFLERGRTWAGTSRQSIDQLVVFDEEMSGGLGTGRVAAARTYGGDPGGLGTGSLCSLNLPNEPQSHLLHTYDSGSLESSRYVEPDDSDETILQVADHDIDNHTGMVKTSRDAAGVPTTFRYDKMARLTRTEPLESAWTIVTYDLPAPTSNAQPELLVEQCPAGATSCSPLSTRNSTFDGLGRLIKEGLSYPDETGIDGSARHFTYDAMGRKITESTWETASLKNEFEYDRFGRVTKITSADTSLAPTVLRYLGDRRIDRTDKVATRFEGGCRALGLLPRALRRLRPPYQRQRRPGQQQPGRLPERGQHRPPDHLFL